MSPSRKKKVKDLIDSLEQKIELASYELKVGDLVKVNIPVDFEDPDTTFTTYPGIVLKDSDGIACFVHVFYDNQSYYVHWQQVEKLHGP